MDTDMDMDMDTSTIAGQSVSNARNSVEEEMGRGESPMTVDESNTHYMTAVEAIQLLVYLLTMTDVKAIGCATQAASAQSAKADPMRKSMRKLAKKVEILKHHNQAFEMDLQQKLMQDLREVLEKEKSGRQNLPGILQQHSFADLSKSKLTNIVEYVMNNVQYSFVDSDLAHRVQCLRGQYHTIKSEISEHVWQQAILLACHQDKFIYEQKAHQTDREENDVLQTLKQVSGSGTLLNQLLIGQEHKVYSSVLTEFYRAIDYCASAMSDKKGSWHVPGNTQGALPIRECADFPINSRSRKGSIITRVIAGRIRQLAKSLQLSSSYEAVLSQPPTGEEMQKRSQAKNDAVCKTRSILIELLNDIQQMQATVALLLANSLRCLLIPSYSKASGALPVLSADKMQLICRQMLFTSIGLFLPTSSGVKNAAIKTIQPRADPWTSMCTWWIHLQALIDQLDWYQGELELPNNAALRTIYKMMWHIPLNDDAELSAWYTVNLFLEKTLETIKQIQRDRAHQNSFDRRIQTDLDTPKSYSAAPARRLQRETCTNTTTVHRMPAFIIPPNSSLAYLRCDPTIIISTNQLGITAPTPIITQARPGTLNTPAQSSIGLEINFSPISAVQSSNNHLPQVSAAHQVAVKWDDATVGGNVPIKIEQASTTQTAPLGDTFQWAREGVRRVLKRQRETQKINAETAKLREMTEQKIAAASMLPSQADNTHLL